MEQDTETEGTLMEPETAGTGRVHHFDEPRNMRPVIMAVVAIAIIGILSFFIVGRLGKQTAGTASSTVPQKPLLLGKTTAPASLYISNAIVNITAINLEWHYTGPSNVSGTVCGGAEFMTNANPYNYYENSFTWAGGSSAGGVVYPTEYQNTYAENSTLSFVLILNSGKYCTVTLNRVVLSTSGFSVASSVPPLPLTVAENSSEEVLLNIHTPSQYFMGPISINFYETGAAAAQNSTGAT